MTMNVDAGWCTSLDSEWDLFGGEIKLTSIDCGFDNVALQTDSSEEVGWQAAEDDDLSVCSSAASWSCLQGSNLLETYCEMYSDLCNHEDGIKFNLLLPDELIADTASCTHDDLPVSLEQFYEINRLIDADAEVESSNSHRLPFSRSVIDTEPVSMAESCGSVGEMDISKMPDCSDTSLCTVNDTDLSSPDSEVASLDYEELYEESVTVDNVLSTISCQELEHLMTGSCDESVVEIEPSEDVETFHLSGHHAPAQPTSSRRLRKKEQNKTAALRYRLKKRSEQGLVLTEYAMLERRNIELRTRLDVMTKEISYLKSLIDELCP